MTFPMEKLKEYKVLQCMLSQDRMTIMENDIASDVLYWIWNNDNRLNVQKLLSEFEQRAHEDSEWIDKYKIVRYLIEEKSQT
jgi:hypothetical protein